MSEVNKEHVERVIKVAKQHGCFDNREDLVAFSTGFAASTAASAADRADAGTKKAFDAGYMASSASEKDSGKGAAKVSSKAPTAKESCKDCSDIAWKINAALKPAMAKAGKSKRWHSVAGANLTGLLHHNACPSTVLDGSAWVC